MFIIFRQQLSFVWFLKEGFGDTEAEQVLEIATLTNSLSPDLLIVHVAHMLACLALNHSDI